MRTAHISNLTGLRGFAALSVLLLHIRYGALSEPYEPFAFLFNTRGLGVDVFFVLSGFILAYVHGKDFSKTISLKAARQFWVARLARIYPVHLFMLVLTAFILPMHRLYEWSPVDTAQTFYANLLLIHAWGVTDSLTFNQPSWSISCEWAAYLLFPILAFITRKWGKLSFTLLLLGTAIAAPYLQPNLLANGIWTIKCIVYFVAGYCTYQVCHDLPDSKLWRVVAIAIAPVMLIMLWAPSARAVFDMTFPFLVIVMIASLFRAGPIWAYSNPVSVYLGKISFSLYMCHIMVMFVQRRMFGMLDLKYEIPLIILFSMFLYHVIEEPARKLIRDISDAKGNARPATETVQRGQVVEVEDGADPKALPRATVN
ncbi:MAG: acyltransferase [Nevskiaceae bacterium]|nr:MAG: acyltransferase [Nevskiaceae bacterium]